jgi:hypothetical protein
VGLLVDVVDTKVLGSDTVSASTNSPHEGVKSPIRITLGLSRKGSQAGLALEPH